MINVYIYTDSERNAKSLVTGLMEANLVAHASIDKDNNSFIKNNGKITERINYVITGQSKALLFNEIVNFVEKQGQETTRIYSLPITQCNENFSEIIRVNTKKI